MNSMLRMVLTSLVAASSLAATSMAYAGDASEDEAALAASESESSEADLAPGCTYGYSLRNTAINRTVGNTLKKIGTLHLMVSSCGLYARVVPSSGYASYFSNAVASLEWSNGTYINGTADYTASAAYPYQTGIKGSAYFNYWDGYAWVWGGIVTTGAS